MQRSFDVIVVGAGAMGSAALYQLARRGVRVAGFDRFTPPHAHGSTHGRSRIIREAYYEHPLYVPLVQRAYELWDELARAWEGEAPLFRRTGGVMLGPSNGVLVAGARRSAHAHRLPHEELTARELSGRFPAFALPEDMVALLEPRAGVLDPEQCVAAQLTLAARAGADLRLGEPVVRWRAGADGVSITTAERSYAAGRLVVATGAWTPALLPGLPMALRVERQVMHWFRPVADPARFAPERCPIAMVEYAPERLFYTIPDAGAGVKAAIHHEGEATTPEAVRRAVTEADVAPVRALLRRFLPLANGALLDSATCLYTNTPDGHFLIDTHPEHSRVLVVSACSGHGFKFASVIGEIVADLATGARPRFDPAPFGLARQGGG